MTLREEILKSAGVLTEMPLRLVKRENLESISIVFYGLRVYCKNKLEKNIDFERGEEEKYRKEVLDFILSSNIEKDTVNANVSYGLKKPEFYDKDVFVTISGPLTDDEEDYFKYTYRFNGSDGKKIINHIINTVGKANVLEQIKKFEEFIPKHPHFAYKEETLDNLQKTKKILNSSY